MSIACGKLARNTHFFSFERFIMVNMAKRKFILGTLLTIFLLAPFWSLVQADPADSLGGIPTHVTRFQAPGQPMRPMVTPTAPAINARGYILMDAYSGKILSAKNHELRVAPASLTKMMTSYIISGALRAGRIHLDDAVFISRDAWKTGGSKMFVKVNDRVPVRDLMQGIIVDSGNDACVAMAEFVAGSQESFVNLMNQQAALLGMTSTHFADVNGLPDPQHYTSARDMAILARALIFDYPEDYKWYSQKWFTFNNIKQPNRNRLLWRDPSVDGIKTGHTDDAGYCLVASAVRNNMRLISVVMGAPTDHDRAEDSQKLLNYGFRFFETHKLYAGNASLTQARVWMGEKAEVPAGLARDLYVTVPIGQYGNLKASMNMTLPIKAPIKQGQELGNVEAKLDGKVVASAPLVALEASPTGGILRRMSDRISLLFAKN